ncbi:P-loop containing nucleoside triphosphate hydrolase protein [Pelagophyceae sp. CCMP2097]|nr:P-loop containing nucleoside triphosphate hydrolase protein [Pelagophyceae sp. CCMP2097]
MGQDGGIDSLTFGLLSALKTGDARLDVLVVALLPALVALAAAASRALQPLVSDACGGLARGTFRRVVRVERRHAQWSSRAVDGNDDCNAVLHRAISLHLGRCGALEKQPAARLRLLPAATAAKPARRVRGASDAEGHAVVRAVDDDVWVDVGRGVRIQRVVDDGSGEQGENEGDKDREPNVEKVDFVLECDGDALAIDNFVADAFAAYKMHVEATDDSDARYLYVQNAASAAGGDDDESATGPTYKRYRLEASKTFKSLFFPEKPRLLSLLDAFAERRGKFGVRGFPRKLGIMLHGPPGTGKTSLIKAIAHRTGRSVVSIPLGRVVTNQDLMDAMFDLRFNVVGLDCPVRLAFSQAIFVLEDIDAASPVVLARANAEGAPPPRPAAAAPAGGDDPLVQLLMMMTAAEGPAKGGAGRSSPFMAADSSDALDLSGVLNVLDGVVDSPERIVIVTTNHPEKLDPALVRPGRIDLKLELGFVQEAEALEMARHYVLGGEVLEAGAVAALRGAWCGCGAARLGMAPAQLEQLLAQCDTLEDVVAALGAS